MSNIYLSGIISNTFIIISFMSFFFELSWYSDRKLFWSIINILFLIILWSKNIDLRGFSDLKCGFINWKCILVCLFDHLLDLLFNLLVIIEYLIKVAQLHLFYNFFFILSHIRN